MEDRRRRMEDQKLWSGLALNQDFAKGKGLIPKIKTSKWEDVLSEAVYLKRITNGDLGGVPLAAARFLVIVWKKSYFNAMESHFVRVQSHLKEIDS